MLHRLVPWTAGTGLLLGVVWLQSEHLKTRQAGVLPLTTLQRQDQHDQVRLTLLRQLPTFGYDNMIANWTFLHFLQYFGDVKVRDQVGYHLSPEFFEVIVDRDPRFITPYLYMASSTSMYAAMPERTIEIMDRGLSSMTPQIPPKGYFVWRNKAIDQLLFLGDSKGARQSFEMAAKWADQSNDPNAANIAQASRQTAQFLAKNPSSKAAQISAWVQVASYAIDDETRRLAIERIESLGGEVLANELGQVTVRYRTDE